MWFSYGLWAGAVKVPREWKRESHTWVSKTVVSQRTVRRRLECNESPGK